jgi:hypothetical protein
MTIRNKRRSTLYERYHTAIQYFDLFFIVKSEGFRRRVN